MLIAWDDSYKIGHDIIDKQHKEFFKIASKVEEAYDGAVSKDEIKKLLTFLFKYMKFHFNEEEKLMLECNYPNLNKHKLEHKKIIQDMSKLIKTAHTTNALKEDLYKITQEWAIVHIPTLDKDLHNYIIKLQNV